MAVALECVLLLNPLRFLAIMMSLGFANYVFVVEATYYTIDELHSLNECAKAERSQKEQQHNYELFSKLICMHSGAKEFRKIFATQLHVCMDKTLILFRIFLRLIRNISYLYETILTSVFAGSTAAMCIAMMMIHMEIVEYFLPFVRSL